ncbi:hypothetical protein DE146DRAFT_61801 [Phaeosphaeria sp. MPI-PUGE-AT-0046c]|nr:hypothetical protein DE146DRAFT_61801 [Phaeosphaeria sp. MPI-PUGE-AT-0046c]
MSTYLFTNRTSITGYTLVPLIPVALKIIAYFIQLYIQAEKLSSSLLSGAYYLPSTLTTVPGADVAGWALFKWAATFFSIFRSRIHSKWLGAIFHA